MRSTAPTAETESLLACLGARRRGILAVVEGLDEASLRRAVLPSGWTLLGLLQHLTVNERYWLRWAVGGEDVAGTGVVDGACRVVLADQLDPADDWAVAAGVDGAVLIARYRAEADLADAAVRALGGLDLGAPAARQDDPWRRWFGAEPRSVRWVLLHLIEETAQHLGHADVVRELLDDAPRGSSGPA